MEYDFSCFVLTVNMGHVQPQQEEQKSEEKLNAERANFLLHQAFDEDEAGNLAEAKELYTEAVEVFLKIVRVISLRCGNLCQNRTCYFSSLWKSSSKSYVLLAHLS
jgi:hypothetical protein